MASKKKNYTNFTTDWEKMYDFWNMTKGDFLKSYSYLTEEEYNLTCDETIGCRICSHEIPRIVTWDDFREAIEVQLRNFRDKYNHKPAADIYNEAYTIAQHEAIASFFIENLELEDYYQRLAPYLDNLLEDFCIYEWNCDVATWTDWGKLIVNLDYYIKEKEKEKAYNNKEEN